MSWLNQSQHGASLLATATRLLQMQQHVQQALPPPLNMACQILRWQDDILTLSVPTAAHSSKLRQVVPRLASSLQKHGWQVNEIRVRVQALPRLPMAPGPVPRDERPVITSDGVAAFAQLATTLPEGPLSHAIARLLQRRAATKP